MFKLLRNIRLAESPAFPSEILIEDGRIAAIGTNLYAPRAEAVDGGGLVALPAFVDLHAHFRDPGLTHKEDIESGCRAAVRGGFTTVNLMANTKPVCSTMETVRYVREKAGALGLCEVFQTASITRDFDGKTTSHIADLCEPVRFLSDDGFGVNDTAVLLNAMNAAKQKGFGLMLHEEDPALTGVNDYLAEELPTARDIELAKLTGCRVHFCHVSTARAASEMFSARMNRDNHNITSEVSPHHLFLNDETDYRVAPPLRGDAHRRVLIDMLRHGFIDAIATDHAPHTPEDKQNGANGISGLDLCFATCYTALVGGGFLTLGQLAEKLSANPARILGIGDRKGRLAPGFDADIALVDPDARFIAAESDLASRGKNTSMLGKELWGVVRMTLRKGETVFEKAD